MKSISKLGFRIARTDEVLLFLLGLFSTWQILQVGGFSVSTLLTALTAGYLMLTRGAVIRKDCLLLCLLLSYCLTTILSVCIDIPLSYKKISIMGFLQWILIFLVSMYTSQSSSSKSISSFFKGFDWSCRIQLIWCFLQIFLYRLLNVDLNKLLFGDLLNLAEETSQYRNGTLVCTGLHWHAANLIPILIFLYFRHSSIFMKLACFIAVYFTKNATCMIGIFLCVTWDVVLFTKRTLIDYQGSIKQKVMAYAILAIAMICILAPIIFPKIGEMVEYLILRLYQIQNPTLGNESSAVHFNYYRLLPRILSRISLPEILLGSGISTSGYRFTQFEGQYPDMTWIVESDVVNQILSCGIIGFLLYYGFLLYLAWKLLKRKHARYACVLLVLIACGFIYNNQFLWLQSAELFLYVQLQYGNRCLLLGTEDQ